MVDGYATVWYYVVMNPREVMIFGGGVAVHDDVATLGVPTQQRVDRFLELYHDNPNHFRAREALVLCTGGYGLLAAGALPPERDEWREARVMADCLVQNGVPPGIIECEDQSGSTLTNWTQSVIGGLITPERFSPDNPLGLVSHPNHLRRIEDIGRRIGFKDTVRIPTKERDSYVGEMARRMLYGVALFGVHTPEELETRESEVILPAMQALRGSRT